MLFLSHVNKIAPLTLFQWTMLHKQLQNDNLIYTLKPTQQLHSWKRRCTWKVKWIHEASFFPCFLNVWLLSLCGNDSRLDSFCSFCGLCALKRHTHNETHSHLLFSQTVFICAFSLTLEEHEKRFICDSNATNWDCQCDCSDPEFDPCDCPGVKCFWNSFDVFAAILIHLLHWRKSLIFQNRNWSNCGVGSLNVAQDKHYRISSLFVSDHSLSLSHNWYSMYDCHETNRILSNNKLPTLSDLKTLNTITLFAFFFKLTRFFFHCSCLFQGSFKHWHGRNSVGPTATQSQVTWLES